MDFGKILDDWEKEEKKNKEEKKRQPANGQARAKDGTGEALDRPVKPDFGESLRAYLNRYGVPDKDLELDAEAEREQSETGLDMNWMRPQAAIDLHGLGAAEAERRLLIFLEQSRRRGLAKVLIIHGKGNHSEEEPILGALVRRVLDECRFAGRRGIPDKRLGGKGAVWVALKGNPQN
jgi:DNA-nicking Smr family endonuclease